MCDTGADKSVLRDTLPQIKPGSKWITVVSADGRMVVQRISEKQLVTDEEGFTVEADFVLSPDCPVNLLGRDLLRKLQLVLVPTDKGVVVKRCTCCRGKLLHRIS